MELTILKHHKLV